MSEVREAPAHRPPSSALTRLVRIEARLAFREPTGIILGLGIPAALLAIFGAVSYYTTRLRENVPGTTLSVLAAYLPILIEMALIMLALLSMPLPIVRDRELGWLRRLSTTPVPPAWLLVAQVLFNLVLVAVAQVILLVGGVVILGLSWPASPAGFVLAVVLATAAMFAVGVLIAARAATERSAGGWATGLLYPLLFFGGVYVPTGFLPRSLRTLSLLTPSGAGVHAMDTAVQGNLPGLQDVGVLAGYAVLLGGLAVRYFRWA